MTTHHDTRAAIWMPEVPAFATLLRGRLRTANLRALHYCLTAPQVLTEPEAPQPGHTPPTLIGVVSKFVAAARRRFNDDLDQAFLDQGL